MIHEALEKVVAGHDLSRDEMRAAMDEFSSGRATHVQFVALFTALFMKGMTSDESAVIEEERQRAAAEVPTTCTIGEETSLHSPDLSIITQVVLGGGNDLSRKEAEAAMEEILSGRAGDAEIAAFLTALRFKGETVDELVGFATAMRRHATPIFPPGHPLADEALVDTCGTGGDASGTFNVSTAAAFVVAGAGVRVAKHGNRSISSRCGSADVLEQLGVWIDMPPASVARAIEEVGIGFLFAPAVHSATRHAMAARRELKMRTVFNLLGPLTNPAGASAQVVGVYDASLTALMAQALGELGVRRAFVVHGADGLDEISISGETHVAELRDGVVRTFTVTPEDFGLRGAPLDTIRGGDAKQNAEIIHKVLGRSMLYRDHGPHRDIVLANAAAALVAAGRAQDFLDGVRLAAHSIDTGAARERLEALIAFSKAEKDRANLAS
jgi:anthranilate phosphoribosyltransferase